MHLDDALRAELSSLDESLAKALAELSVPEGWDNPTPATPAPTCRCGACGKMHVPAG